MKKITLVLGLALLASCSKTYICTTTVTTTSEFYNNVSTTDVEFKGSKEEVKQYELDNSETFDLYPSGTIVQETICK